jgi:hypothetical protein
MHTISLLFHDVHGGDPSRSGFTGVVANRYKIAVDDFDAVLRELADCDHVRVTVDDGGASYYEMIADRLEQRAARLARLLLHADRHDWHARVPVAPPAA